MAALGSAVDSLGPFVDGDAILDGILRRSRSAWPAAFVTTREITPQLPGPLGCPIDEGVDRLATHGPQTTFVSSLQPAGKKVLINRPISNQQGCCTSSQNSGSAIRPGAHIESRTGWPNSYDGELTATMEAKVSGTEVKNRFRKSRSGLQLNFSRGLLFSGCRERVASGDVPSRLSKRMRPPH